jgi:tripartite-type tricarboxylate transporter receptor subunit TctC
MQRSIQLLLTALGLALMTAVASAQSQYPNKAIRVLLPYAPGGLTDVVARLYAEQLRKDLGQQVVIENKPGASGIIAIEQMVHARPDGYTIMIGNISTNGLTPILLTKMMSINYEKDVQIVARLADTPVFFMATTHDFPPKTFAEFVDYARARPGVVRYASAGIGAYQHVNTEIIAKRLGGLKLLHIPYKDGGPGILKDLSNGDVQVSWFNITNPVGMMKAGHVRPLAISAQQRMAAYPDVPTIDEVGLPGVRATQWTAAFAPAGVPRDIVEALHKAFVKAQSAPELKAAFEKGGMNAPHQSSVADAQTWLKEEMAALARDIKDAGITAEQQ